MSLSKDVLQGAPRSIHTLLMKDDFPLRPLRTVIVGAGYVGLEAARRFVAAGFEAWAGRRSPVEIPNGVHPLRIDALDATTFSNLPAEFTHLVYAVAPSTASAPAGDPGEAYRLGYYQGLRALLGYVSAETVVSLVSSTGVYAQDGGEWITEASEATSPRAGMNWLRAAEDLVLARPHGHVLRLGGIYGPGRERMLRLAREGVPKLTGSYTNRIHQHDAARVILHCATHTDVPRLLVVVDQEPATDNEIVGYLRARIGKPPLAAQPTTPPSGKRIDSRALVQSGFTFTYPTYREGHESLLSGLPATAVPPVKS